METKKTLLAQHLKELHPERLKMVLGFDGFVDEIIHPVDKRLSADSFTRIETIAAFASRLAKASGLSTNVEFVPVAKKIGGNGPIMCNALARHGSAITYIGALGEPGIHGVFKMPDNVKLHSIADSGHTDALEFLDGKLLFGKMHSLNDVTYARLQKMVGEAELVRMLSEADLFASVNWSMLPAMTSVWNSMLQNLLPKMPKREKKPIFFVDIADPEKREHAEIVEALDLLKKFTIRFTVVLGLNKKEAYDVAGVLGLFPKDALAAMTPTLKEVTEAIYRRLWIDAVVVHPVDRSATVRERHLPRSVRPLLRQAETDHRRRRQLQRRLRPRTAARSRPRGSAPHRHGDERILRPQRQESRLRRTHRVRRGVGFREHLNHIDFNRRNRLEWRFFLFPRIHAGRNDENRLHSLLVVK
ncbi:MAG: hypothetical protein MZW92_12695 [Comamonadaceae bacterium]|nr:hypothetical protein [Comamonadaceae bacterium]